MRIVLADKTGFCFGVKRAVGMAEAALKENEEIYSLGSIIHNQEVVRSLASKGLKVVKDRDKVKRGTVVISSHGISPNVLSRMARRGIQIIDTTCPFVLNAQKCAKRLSDEGYVVIIVGEADHPEIKALVDFAPKKALVVRDKAQARRLKLKEGGRISVISQTTQSTENFLDVVKTISESRPRELKVVNTICKDAEDRQVSASSLASKVDVMLVVGGRNSANTNRLFEVCRKTSRKTYLIENENELKREWFKGCRTVGITSGASTPDWIIRKVIDRMNLKKSNRKGLCH